VRFIEVNAFPEIPCPVAHVVDGVVALQSCSAVCTAVTCSEKGAAMVPVNVRLAPLFVTVTARVLERFDNEAKFEMGSTMVHTGEGLAAAPPLLPQSGEALRLINQKPGELWRPKIPASANAPC